MRGELRGQVVNNKHRVHGELSCVSARLFEAILLATDPLAVLLLCLGPLPARRLLLFLVALDGDEEKGGPHCVANDVGALLRFMTICSHPDPNLHCHNSPACVKIRTATSFRTIYQVADYSGAIRPRSEFHSKV